MSIIPFLGGDTFNPNGAAILQQLLTRHGIASETALRPGFIRTISESLHPPKFSR
jgi:hypothetical protein